MSNTPGYVRDFSYGFVVWEFAAPPTGTPTPGSSGRDLNSRPQMSAGAIGSVDWDVLRRVVDDTVDSYVADDDVWLHYKGSRTALRAVYRVVESPTTDANGNMVTAYERMLSVQSRFIPRRIKDVGIIERVDRDGVAPRVQYNKVIGTDRSHQGRTMLLLREIRDFKPHTAPPPRYTATQTSTPYRRYQA